MSVAQARHGLRDRLPIDIDQMNLAKALGEEPQVEVIGVPDPEQTEAAAAPLRCAQADLVRQPDTVPGAMVFVSRDAAVGRELTGQRSRERVFPAHGLACRPSDNL